MTTSFTFPITDTVNDRAAIDQLRREIGEAAITPSLLDGPEGVMCDFISIYLEFDADLSGAEETTLSGVISSHTGDGDFDFLILSTVAKASLPSYAAQGWMVFVTDEAGGPQPAYFDGTNWRRVSDGAIVS